MDDCIFCKIVNGIQPSHKIYEDDEFLAFLSIFPNTEGFSIVIPKTHYPSYAFDLPDDLLCRLMLVSKKVAKQIDARFDDVGRTGLIIEGMGVNHVHTKLIPLHGTNNIPKWEPVIAYQDKYFKKYEGYLSSHDCVRKDDKELEKIAKKLRF